MRWLALAALLALFALTSGSGAGWTTPPAHALADSSGRSGGAAGAAGAAQWRAANTRTSMVWHDYTRGTSFALRPLPTGGLLLRATAGPEFVFVLPDGSQVLGDSLALATILNNLTSLGPGDPFDVTQTICTAAQRIFPVAGAAAQNGKASNEYTDVGDARLVLHIGQGGLIAYAGIGFTSGVAACSQPPTWEMMAGCVGATSPADCTPPAPPATAAATYGTTFSAAVQSRNWGAVFTLNSQIIQAQYSESSFAALMNQDATRYGRITSISAPLSTPAITFDDDGQAYFTATQRVTLAASGNATRQITSYFLLEGGAWHFWFSM